MLDSGDSLHHLGLQTLEIVHLLFQDLVVVYLDGFRIVHIRLASCELLLVFWQSAGEQPLLEVDWVVLRHATAISENMVTMRGAVSLPHQSM